MRAPRKTLAFVGALLLVPALAMAAVQTGAASPVKAQKATKIAKTATHATSGVIKSVDATSLVIAKTAKATKTDTFQLTTATVRKGDLAVGAHVEVRYAAEGGQNVATAVTASAAK